jgi:2-dehydropantoate 2-reductase
MASEILIVGPGAIGIAFAVRLARSGYKVTVACKSRETAAVIAGRGLSFETLAGTRETATVETVASPEQLRGRPAFAVLATKCADAEPAVRAWAPRLPPDCPIVAVQNGVLGPDLTAAGGGRVLDAVVTFAATLEASTTAVETSKGMFVLGRWDSQTGVPPYVADALGCVAPVRVTSNIRGARWTKLLISSTINSLGIVGGCALRELLASAPSRDVFLALITEGYRAGVADGVAFETVAGFHPRMFALKPGATWISVAAKHLLLRLLAHKARRQRSSSLQSFERGRKTEVDYLNGFVLRTAARRHVSAPTHEAVLRRVHEIEAGKRRPSLALIEELVATPIDATPTRAMETP